jgi:hypothetical protein
MYYFRVHARQARNKQKFASSQKCHIWLSQRIVFYCKLKHFLSCAAQVFSGCGKPLLGRRRRDTTELEFESLQFGRSEDAENGESNNVPTLDKLVKDIRQKVQCSMYCFCNLYISLVYVGQYLSVCGYVVFMEIGCQEVTEPGHNSCRRLLFQSVL